MAASTLLLVDFGWTDAREVPQFSTRKRRVAGRPWAGVRPARPKGSHKHYPFLSNSSSAYSSSPPAESSNERRRVAEAKHPFTAPILLGSGLRAPGAPPRAANASLRPKTAIPFRIALLALNSKLAPILRPVSTSLRLRFRSATSVTRWDFISILLTQNERNPSLGGRATVFAHCSFFARLARFIYIRLPPK